MLAVQELSIPGVKLVRPRVFDDPRGTMTEVAHDARFRELGFPDFVQENQSFSRLRGTIRGMHFQKPPQAQAKLVRVLRGQIFDVAVDVRPQSASFGRHAVAMLSEDELAWLYVPEGFAHGFCTLTKDVQVLYKVSSYYAPGSECGMRWNDPALGIDWPISPSEAVLSDKDMQLPLFKDLPAVIWG
ncbi:MAG: dTDP-4-dehydrorhamnose 3,5-epimerase [Bdellovibrionales bacterium]